MKKLKLFSAMLLAAVLPLTVWADDTELKVFNSTFTGATYGVAGETYSTGTLTTDEGNDWTWEGEGELKSPVIQTTEVGGVTCLSAKLKTASFAISTDFSVPGNIQELFFTLGGNIGIFDINFGGQTFRYNLNLSDNGLHSYKFTYEGMELQSTNPGQKVTVVFYPKDESSSDPILIRYASIGTEVISLGNKSIISDFLDFDVYNDVFLTENNAYDWLLALPYMGTILEDAYPTTWNDEQCIYMRVTSNSSSYTNLRFTSAFPVLGKVKKIIINAGGDVRVASYTNSDGGTLYSEESYESLPYYRDFVIDLGDGIEMDGNLMFDLVVGRNTFLNSVTIVIEDDAVEPEGLTSTFYAWEEWDVTDNFKVGAIKTKEDTPWLAFIYNPTAPVYMTSIKFGEDAEPEECMLIGNNDGQPLEIELQNQFIVTGPVRKIIIKYTGHIESITAGIIERGTGENEQFTRVTPREGFGFTEVELVFDGTIEYTDADIRMFLNGNAPIFLKSITIVQEEGSSTEIPSGKCGDNLDYAITPLPYSVWVYDYNAGQSYEEPAYRLTITGTGDMYDYDGWYSVAPWMDKYRENIAEIVLPEGMTRVGDEAFDGCTNSRVERLPSTLKSIGSFAFSNVYFMEADMYLPDGLTSLSDHALSYSQGPKNLHLPASLTSIGEGAICSIYYLENYYVDEANPIYKIDGGAVIEKATDTLIAGTPNSVIPDYVKAIGPYAFFNERIEEMPIPAGVTSIGSFAFGYTYISNLVIPNSVKTIGNYTFYGCSKLLNVTIGSGVTQIGNNSFYNSTNILDVSCYANPDALTWKFTSNSEDRSFKPDKMTKMHVRAADLEKWETNFGFLNVTFVGDLGDAITPIDDETSVAVSSLQGEDLSDNIVDNVYYNLDATTGSGYMNGCLFVGQTTDMSLINDGNPGSDDIRDNFTGIILEVSPGKGVITVNAWTIGKTRLAVRIGEGTPTYAVRNERGDVYVSYDVTEPTYVYIYSVGEGSALVRAYDNDGSETGENVLLIYGITISPGADETGINEIGQQTTNNSQQPIYNLAGQRIQKMQHGINIVNGKKVLR